MVGTRESAGPRRVPDFVIIGAMKAGTTTVFRWLESHPGCALPIVKEPHYFSRESRFKRGPSWYLAHFAELPSGLLTGEASASYADPRIAEVVSERMVDLLPDLRLIYLVRSPEARLKSHYLHEWQRSRERRPFDAAVRDPHNPYVAMSCYADSVSPFVERYGPESVLIVDLEALRASQGPGWPALTAHLGLAPLAGPEEHANRSGAKVAFSPLVLRIWQRGGLDLVGRAHPGVRRLGRRLAGRRTALLERTRRQVLEARLPEQVAARLADQWEILHAAHQVVGSDADIAP